MSGRTSSAVMAQRVEPPDSLDYFPTPPWATRAFINDVMLQPRLDREPWLHSSCSIWDPACGEGHMTHVFRETGCSVFGSDVYDYGVPHGVYQHWLADFPTLREAAWEMYGTGFDPDFIISNPPFQLGLEFVETALAIATSGVAMFVRLQFVEGVERYKRLFADRPPTLIVFMADRVPMIKGAFDPEASTATAYCWLVWMRDEQLEPPIWIAPGAKSRWHMERDMPLAKVGEAARRRKEALAYEGFGSVPDAPFFNVSRPQVPSQNTALTRPREE